MGGFWGLGFAAIVNDDAAIIPGAASMTEGDSGTTVVEVPVTLSSPATATVTVEWSTVFAVGAPAGQAEEGADYLAASGTVTFAPGETSKSVAVEILGDLDAEADEYIVVSFHNPTNAFIGGFWGLGFAGIINDD